jgi:hypothetical protein
MAGKESAQVQVPVTNYLVPIRATGITGGTAQVPPCRAASRAASQVRGALRPGNTDHFRGEVAVARAGCGARITPATAQAAPQQCSVTTCLNGSTH